MLYETNSVSEAAATAHDSDDKLLYDTNTGNLYYDADGIAIKHTAKLICTLDNHFGLNSTDILVG